MTVGGRTIGSMRIVSKMAFPLKDFLANSRPANVPNIITTTPDIVAIFKDNQIGLKNSSIKSLFSSKSIFLKYL